MQNIKRTCCHCFQPRLVGSLIIMLLVFLVPAGYVPAADVTVDFASALREWDGFGVNYVQNAQTTDPVINPQDVGGFSYLSIAQRQTILDMVFGGDGLKPGIIKMFITPFNEGDTAADNDNGDPNVINMAGFDFSAQDLEFAFAEAGLSITNARGGDLNMFCTLYSPPGWMTTDDVVRGKYLAQSYKYECGEYMIAFAKYCRENRGLPVNYISLHNEGEADWRWPTHFDGDYRMTHDYNMAWGETQVVDFLGFMRGMLDTQGMTDVGMMSGEPTSWSRSNSYAAAIKDDSDALNGLSLYSSHGFLSSWSSTGVSTLRGEKPGMHAWVNSASFNANTTSLTTTSFAYDIYKHIYSAQVNGYTPWAFIQLEDEWYGGDPNPNCCFHVQRSGSYTVDELYYWYKQISRAGQPGTAVATVSSTDSDVLVIAFASNGSGNDDAFIVTNKSSSSKSVNIDVNGAAAGSFRAYRSGNGEEYELLGDFALAGGTLTYTAPGNSITTFFGTAGPLPQALILSSSLLTVDEGSTDAFTVRLQTEPSSTVQVDISRMSGSTDVDAVPGTLSFTSSNWNTPQSITVSAAHDADDLNDSAVISIVSSGLTTHTVAVTVQDDEVPPAVLLVAGSTSLGSGDSAVQSRIEGMGYTVTVKAASSAVSSDADGKALVLVSSTVSSSDVGTKFRNAGTPVIVWEPWLYDDMGMTGGTSETDYGYSSGVSQLTINAAGHPLAGGLTGTVTIFSAGRDAGWGEPNLNAVEAAVLSGGTAGSFGYDTGASMPGLTAPARRVGLFIFDAGGAYLTADGWTLFDAAVTWALGGGGPSNIPPTVDAGVDQAITLPDNDADLNAAVTDPDDTPVTAWSMVSGPGSVIFSNPAAIDTTASFSSAGTYVLRLTADDGTNAAVSDTVTVTVEPEIVNIAPAVDAGVDQNITLPTDTVSLDGMVTDPDDTPSIAWTKQSGPSTVSFGNASNIDTTAQFSAAGSYVLRLTADDGTNAAVSDTVTITVEPETVNVPPTVDAGVDQSITLPDNDADLNGTVSDPDDTPSIQWSQTSGPGTATFSNSSLADTTAFFSGAGTYVLQLTADDGTNPAVSDSITVTVNPAPSDDTDGDGMDDSWEIDTFGDLSHDGTDDGDFDGLTDLQEFGYGTDPFDPDSDGDGLEDGWEILFGFDPLDPADAGIDGDGDGLSNAEEFLYNTNPLDADSDGDGLNDGDEITAGTQPLDPDTDNDGYLDGVDPDPLDASNPGDGGGAATGCLPGGTAVAFFIMLIPGLLAGLARRRYVLLLGLLLVVGTAGLVSGQEIFSDDFNTSDSYYPEYTVNATTQEYSTALPGGYLLKKWNYSWAYDADGYWKQAFYCVPEGKTYMEQGGRSGGTGYRITANAEIPVSATAYTVTFKQYRNDNDPIHFVFGADSSGSNGTDIYYETQIPGTDTTTSDAYIKGALGSLKKDGMAKMRTWVTHVFEVNISTGHIRWECNGTLMIEGTASSLDSGGYFGIWQWYERGTRYDDVSIVLNGSTPNTPPTVDAGSGQTITLPNDTVSLNGTVTDQDDTPTTVWAKQSGSGSVSFGNASNIDTTAQFSAAGSYVLRLTADDGTNTPVSDTVTITVNPEPTNDADGDGMHDDWELLHGVDDPDDDPDGDGFTNLQEFGAGTDPWNPDTDDDGIPDGIDPTPAGDPASSEGTKAGCMPGSADAGGLLVLLLSLWTLIGIKRKSS